MDKARAFSARIAPAARDLLCAGDTVLCAVSGGADSVALLRVLLALRDTLDITLCACHVHHGLRGAEADRDADFVRDLCASHGVPCQIVYRDVPAYAKAHGVGTEEAARIVRYDALRQAAHAQGAAKIALAHTLDDNLETMLFHLARGTGARGLAGIPPVRDDLVRPLLGATRIEVEDYLSALGQPYMTDSSNDSMDYTRNRIRRDIVPILRQLNPRCAHAAGRAARLLRTDDDYLSAQAAALRDTLALPCDAGVLLRRDGLRAAHTALRTRVLRGALRDVGMPMLECTADLIDRLEALLDTQSPSATLSLPDGLTAARRYDALYLGRTQPHTLPRELPLHLNTPPLVWDNRATLTVFLTDHAQDFYKTFNTFSLNCDKIDADTLCVRTRRTGDAIRLTADGGSRTLKRLMIDRRIPRDTRDTLAVIADKNGVIAAENIGTDIERAAQTGSALIIKLKGI